VFAIYTIAVLIKFAEICRRQNPSQADAIWANVFEDIIDFINGKIALEALQRQLPQDIESEKPL
jgi:vacuolar-type H+-ATPase subunit C/Vma6